MLVTILLINYSIYHHEICRTYCQEYKESHRVLLIYKEVVLSTERNISVTTSEIKYIVNNDNGIIVILNAELKVEPSSCQ